MQLPLVQIALASSVPITSNNAHVEFFAPVAGLSDTIMTCDEQSHPWLAEVVSDNSSLLAHEWILTFLAANCAVGDVEGIGRDWSHLADTHHGAGIEVILQTHLFAGYPRTINALARVAEVGIKGEVASAESTEADGSAYRKWRRAGEELCATVYGSSYEMLRGRMRQLHPDLERWMLETGYGRVLSRPGCGLRLRELCVIAVLAGQNVKRQLHSHLRGAIFAGATRAEIHAVIGQTHLAWGQLAQDQANAVWQVFVARESARAATD